MNNNNLTNIGRPIDLKYPTNLAILIITILIFISSLFCTLILGESILDSFYTSFVFSLSVFFGWAICREINPDYNLAAFISCGITLFGLIFFLNTPSLLDLLWLLMILRIVNRTVGPNARLSDSIFILILSIWLSFDRIWIFGLITSLAFFLDSKLSNSNKNHLFFSIFSAIFTIFLKNNLLFDIQISNFIAIFVITVSILFFYFSITLDEVESMSDKENLPLNLTRIKLTQILALFCGIMFVLHSSIDLFFPLWASILGILINRILIIAK